MENAPNVRGCLGLIQNVIEILKEPLFVISVCVVICRVASAFPATRDLMETWKEDIQMQQWQDQQTESFRRSGRIPDVFVPAKH